jgi:Flp pilus assembly protein TadG
MAMNRRRSDQRGTVTAEVAILLPMLLATIVAGCWAAGVVVATIRCTDAARDAARAVARGESVDTATAIGHRAAPPDADIEITREGDDIHVSVQADAGSVRPIFNALPTIRVHGQATLQAEPTSEHP